jgi:hypothetical protein
MISTTGGRFPWGLSSTNSASATLHQNGFSDGADATGVATFCFNHHSFFQKYILLYSRKELFGKEILLRFLSKKLLTVFYLQKA